MKRSGLLLVLLLVLSAPALAVYSEVDLGYAGGDTHLELQFEYDGIVAFVSGESAKRNNENDIYNLMSLGLGYKVGDLTPFVASVMVSEEHYKLGLDPDKGRVIVLDAKKDDVLSVGVKYRKTLDKFLLSGQVQIFNYADYTGHYYNAECGYEFYDSRYYATVGYSQWQKDKSTKLGGLEIGARLTF